jgi:hypothetical protein
LSVVHARDPTFDIRGNGCEPVLNMGKGRNATSLGRTIEGVLKNIFCQVQPFYVTRKVGLD